MENQVEELRQQMKVGQDKLDAWVKQRRADLLKSKQQHQQNVMENKGK